MIEGPRKGAKQQKKPGTETAIRISLGRRCIGHFRSHPVETFKKLRLCQKILKSSWSPKRLSQKQEDRFYQKSGSIVMLRKWHCPTGVPGVRGLCFFSTQQITFFFKNADVIFFVFEDQTFFRVLPLILKISFNTIRRIFLQFEKRIAVQMYQVTPFFLLDFFTG